MTDQHTDNNDIQPIQAGPPTRETVEPAVPPDAGSQEIARRPTDQLALSLGFQVPDTVKGVTQAIGELYLRSEMNRTLYYWNMGLGIDMLRDLGIKHPADVAAQATCLSPRLLRYCEAVHSTFDDYDALVRWVGMGLTWCAARELTSSHLDSHREFLLEAFEARTVTPAEMEIEAIRLRKAHVAGLQDEPLLPTEAEAKLIEVMDVARKEAKRLEKVADDVLKGLRSGLADGLTAADGSVSETAENKVLAMNTALHDAVVVACELLHKSHEMAIVMGHPFYHIHKRITELIEIAGGVTVYGLASKPGPSADDILRIVSAIARANPTDYPDELFAGIIAEIAKAYPKYHASQKDFLAEEHAQIKAQADAARTADEASDDQVPAPVSGLLVL